MRRKHLNEWLSPFVTKERKMSSKAPKRIFLTEDEMPKQWYNVRADMKNKPAAMLNPGTLNQLQLKNSSMFFAPNL